MVQGILRLLSWDPTLRTADLKSQLKDFPGGPVVKKLPASGGDPGLIPGLGRSHMLQSNQACVPQLLSLCSTTAETVSCGTKACAPTAHALQPEKPPQ